MKKLFILLVLLLMLGFLKNSYAADGDPVVEGTSPSFTGITVEASATPSWAAEDSTATAVGTFEISIDSFTATYDSQIIFKVDDSVGEDQTYLTIDGSGEEITAHKPLVADVVLAMTPQSLSVTGDANITLTGSLLLLTGDNTSTNKTIDLQDGTVTGQILTIVAIAAVDSNDTITVAMTDTTCTGCLTVLMDEIGDTWGLVWTGATWATISNSEAP